MEYAFAYVLSYRTNAWIAGRVQLTATHGYTNANTYSKKSDLGRLLISVQCLQSHNIWDCVLSTFVISWRSPEI